MAARSMASVTVSFGLVAIPVKVYSATQSSGTISFNLLHKKCGSRLRQQYLCIKEGIPVERDDIVKGYEFAKGQYVQFTPEEIKKLEEIGTHSIDIAEFVPLASVDPMYFDRTYYLAPDERGAKAYSLFTRALRDSELVAIGTWAARGKQYLVSLRPAGDVLVMQQLLFADEVRPPGEIEVVPTPIRENELKLARQLIDQQTSEAFDPTAYRDEVKARVRAEIEKKVAGEEIVVAEPERAEGKVIDLMEALRASLEKTGATKRAPRKAPAKRAAATGSSRKTARR
jgi:DNA end-binding protein Ku